MRSGLAQISVVLRRLVLASVAVVGVSYNVYAADVLPVYSKEPSLPPQCTWAGSIRASISVTALAGTPSTWSGRQD